MNEQWTVFSQGALRVSARELEQRVNTVKSDLDKMSQHIDLTTPKLRPWNDGQLDKLKQFARRYVVLNQKTDFFKKKKLAQCELFLV